MFIDVIVVGVLSFSLNSVSVAIADHITNIDFTYKYKNPESGYILTVEYTEDDNESEEWLDGLPRPPNKTLTNLPMLAHLAENYKFLIRCETYKFKEQRD